MKTSHLFRKHHGLSGSIPLGYVVFSLFLGLTLPRAEHYLLPGMVSGVSASAAMTICGAVASGMITLTGIVFSLAFVMVQFSSTAYSPRLVGWVARSPVMLHSLGIFVATFLYALVMIAWIDREGSGQVPLMSIWVVVVLLLASMGMFLALLERIALLKVSRMLVFTADHGRKAIAELYSSASGVVPLGKNGDDRPKRPTQTVLHIGRPQAVQAVRVEKLVDLACRSGTVIEVVVAIGDSVLENAPLLRVYGNDGRLEERDLRQAIELGDERTFEQDPKYAIRLIVDIAIKALSPAVNDPTTAVQCLDQIEDLLSRLGRANLEIGTFRDTARNVRVTVPFPAWEDFLRLGLDEIRSYGAQSVQVTRRMMALIDGLLSVLPQERHKELRHWKERIQGTIQRSFADLEEKHQAAVADRQGLGIGVGRAG